MKFLNFYLVSIILFLFASCKSSIQNNVVGSEINYIPYYTKAYKADSLFLTNNFEKSYNLLDSLFKVYKPVNTRNVNEYGVYIASAVMSNHLDKIDDKIRYGIINCGSVSFFHPQSDTIQKKIYLETTKITREEFKDLYDKYKKNNVSPELDTLLVKMYDEDQEARNPELNTGLMRFYEKKHKKKIQYILKKYGYPNYTKVCYMHNKIGIPADFMVLMLHQSIKVKNGFLKFLYDNLKKGIVSPEEYANIYDKIYLEKKESFYGMFPGTKLLHPKSIDSIRKTIGLPHFGYERWKDSIIFPSFYIKNNK